MRPVRSPYAVLGLSPGASRAAIEAAYRALIKLHHPDRSGGDPERAAEINHAFDRLHGTETLGAPVELGAPSLGETRASESAKPWLLVLVIVAVLATMSWRATSAWPWRSAAASPTPVPARQFRADASDSALLPGLGGNPSADAVKSAVTEAVRLSRARDDRAASGFSAECHADLRRSPGLALLDHCLAFDAAMAALSKPTDGAFARPRVAERETAATELLSEDDTARRARIAAVRSLVANLVPEATP